MIIHKLYTTEEKSYNPDVTYHPGETCIFLGSTYVCLEKSTAQTPSISSNWNNIKS